MSTKIHLTAALPTWENRDIIWLQLESLCRQETNLNWELIVCEEQTAAKLSNSSYIPGEGIIFSKGQMVPTMLGEADLLKWTDRLTAAGCKRIKYIPLDERIPLSKKWWLMGQHALGSSFALCAADDYSSPDRFELSHEKISEGYDWFNVKRGMFLNLQTWVTTTFVAENEKRGLTMCANTEKIKNIIGDHWPTYSVDGWLQQKMSKFYQHKDNVAGLDTDGANKICGNRRKQYSANSYRVTHQFGVPVQNFFPPEQEVEDILPTSVIERLKKQDFTSTSVKFLN